MSERYERSIPGWSVLARALGTVLAIGLVRAWLPSVIFVYGAAGSTPATQMGAFAVLPFLAAIVFAAVIRWLPSERLVALGAVVMIVNRIWLQTTNGGDPQLWAATLGVVGVLVWLVASAASGIDRRAVALGHAAGLTLAAVLHAALRTTDLVWRDGAAAWISVLVLLAAFAVATARSTQTDDPAAPAGAWLAFGPALVLSAMYAGAPSRGVAVAGWSEPLADGATAFAHLLGVGLIILLWRLTRPAQVAIALLALGMALVLVPGAVPVGELTLAIGLALALGTHGMDERSCTPGQRARSAANGALLLFIVGFLYYAAYDIALPFPNDVAPIIAALVLVAGLLRVSPLTSPATSPAPRDVLRKVVVAALATGLLIAGVTAIDVDTPTPDPGDGFPVRVMTYNLRMGHSADGAYDPEALAAVINAQQPDIVALQEVDRGWLLNGSHDSLTAIAEAVGMAYVWTPAADEVWGNAILSRFPLHNVTSEVLPRGDTPMDRSVLTAIVDLGGGDELAIVNTHVHHTDDGADIRRPQIERIAAIAAALAQRYPVVIMGDLNAEPGASELRSLDLLFDDGVAAHGPIATFPSTAADRQIDHVYVTDGLATSDLVVPLSEASDHLGVAVTLSRR